MDKDDIVGPIFGLYFLGLIGWQLMEAKRIIDAGVDFNRDGSITISDWWEAWVWAWQTPARSIIAAADPKALQFFEINIYNPPGWLMVPASILAWGVITFLPLLVLYGVLDMLSSVWPKKSKP